ncbi:hypothetical protein ABZZ36_41325 [Actinacidiphila glaucinigra]
MHDGLQKYAPGLNVGEVAPVGTAHAVRVGTTARAWRTPRGSGT